MSNHHHTGIHDPEGNYPAFIEHFHKVFAKCQNALCGRWENFWSSEQASVVRLVDPNDVIAKMTYAITNSVKDHVVEKADHWPGVTSLDALVHGRPLTASRPKQFFREDGPMPDVVSLSFARPEGFEDLSAAAFAAMVMERVWSVEQAAAAERRRTGASILGRKQVLAQRWSDRPGSREPRRQLNPRVAARSKWSRIEALLRDPARARLTSPPFRNRSPLVLDDGGGTRHVVPLLPAPFRRMRSSLRAEPEIFGQTRRRLRVSRPGRRHPVASLTLASPGVLGWTLPAECDNLVRTFRTTFKGIPR